MLTGLGGALFLQPDTIAPMMPGVATTTAGVFAAALPARFASANMRRSRSRSPLGSTTITTSPRQMSLPRWVLRGDQIPWSTSRLFLGRGFRWDQRHSQRLVEARNPEARKYLEPGTAYRIWS